jgi:uncharacterized protein YqeY
VSALEERLRAALRTAMRDRDAVATGALRSTLGALGNATAVPGLALPGTADEHVAGSVVGVGAAEAPRRELTEAEAAAIVRTEIAQRITAAEQYGPSAGADRLRAEAVVLADLLDGTAPGPVDG